MCTRRFSNYTNNFWDFMSFLIFHISELHNSYGMIATSEKKTTCKMREKGVKKRTCRKKTGIRFTIPYFSEASTHNVKWSKGIFRRWCKTGFNAEYEIKTNIIFHSEQLLYFLKIISNFSLSSFPAPTFSLFFDFAVLSATLAPPQTHTVSRLCQQSGSSVLFDALRIPSANKCDEPPKSFLRQK